MGKGITDLFGSHTETSAADGPTEPSGLFRSNDRTTWQFPEPPTTPAPQPDPHGMNLAIIDALGFSHTAFGAAFDDAVNDLLNGPGFDDRLYEALAAIIPPEQAADRWSGHLERMNEHLAPPPTADRRQALIHGAVARLVREAAAVHNKESRP